jgi:hypothetical protein
VVIVKYFSFGFFFFGLYLKRKTRRGIFITKNTKKQPAISFLIQNQKTTPYLYGLSSKALTRLQNQLVVTKKKLAQYN